MIMDKHDTIGIDCVAMCVNDVICAGAKPLVFLDYIACGRNIPEKIAEIVKGVSEGCVQADCSLRCVEETAIPPWTRWLPPPAFWKPTSWARSTTCLLYTSRCV